MQAYRKGVDDHFSTSSRYDRLTGKFLANLIGLLDGLYSDLSFRQKEAIFLDTFLLNYSHIISHSEYSFFAFEKAKDLVNFIASIDSDVTPELENEILEKIEFCSDSILEHSQPLLNAVYSYDEFLIGYLHGFCKGLVSDGIIEEAEVNSLVDLLTDNKTLKNNPICFSLYKKLFSFNFETLTKSDYQSIKKIIIDFCGADECVTNGYSLGNSFFDDVDSISIQNKRIILTGKFAFGSRSVCENFIKKHGGIPVKDPSSTTAYVIVGSLNSENWVYDTFGRKIELAKEFQLKGYPVKIISEEQFFKFFEQNQLKQDEPVKFQEKGDNDVI